MKLTYRLLGAAALGFAGLRALGGLDQAKAKLLPR